MGSVRTGRLVTGFIVGDSLGCEKYPGGLFMIRRWLLEKIIGGVGGAATLLLLMMLGSLEGLLFVGFLSVIDRRCPLRLVSVNNLKGFVFPPLTPLPIPPLPPLPPRVTLLSRVAL